LKDAEHSRDHLELKRDHEYETQEGGILATFEEFMMRMKNDFTKKIDFENIFDDSIKVGIKDLVESQEKILEKAGKDWSGRFEAAQGRRKTILRPVGPKLEFKGSAVVEPYTLHGTTQYDKFTVSTLSESLVTMFFSLYSGAFYEARSHSPATGFVSVILLHAFCEKRLISPFRLEP
jgi:hypothetical protein